MVHPSSSPNPQALRFTICLPAILLVLLPALAAADAPSGPATNPPASLFPDGKVPEASGPLRRVALGSGGVVLDLPPGQHGPQQNPYEKELQVAVVPKLAEGVSGPPKTCSWWSSALWDLGPKQPYGFPIYAWPLGFVACEDGISCGLPSNLTTGTEYHWEFARGADGKLPLRFQPKGMERPELKVAGWGDWTVTLRMTNAGLSMDAVIGKGLPMAWFTSTGAPLEVTPAAAPDFNVWRNERNELGISLLGATYLLTAPAGSSWSTNAPFTPQPAGPVSLAVLPDTNAATLERFRGGATPQDSRVSWSYDEKSATLTSRYELVMAPGAKAPPMALFPHQWLLTQATATDAYNSPRGRMRLVDGGSFTTKAKFPGLLPDLPMPAKDDRFDPTKLNALLEQEADARIPASTDTYAAGKALGKLSALVPIARQAGRNDLADAWLARIKASMTDWLDGAEPNLFRYDAAWGTVYGFPAGFESNGFLQDHHFHWGYFIQAAALLAREDPAWAKDYGPAVELLIRDCANWNRGDKAFAFLRSYDVYEGHAWANGPAAAFPGNNQESSSESVHFDAGVFQWGLATGNRVIRDLGIFLYLNDVEAIHRYWLNEGKLAFPGSFDWPVVGMVWGNGAAHATWFNGNPQFIHGINFLPITPASLHLGRDRDHFLSTLAPFDTPPAEWFDIIECARATADPADAARRLENNEGYAPEGGQSRAATYHWINSLRQLGHCAGTAVTSDNPSAAVFTNAAATNYVGWNPDGTNRTTTFSDGATMEQPGHTLRTKSMPSR